MAAALTPDGAPDDGRPDAAAPDPRAVAREIDAVGAVLRAPAAPADPFDVLRRLAWLVNARGDDPEVHALVLRACERRADLGASAPVLDALVRERGLFPYLRPRDLGLADRLAYAMHRPLGAEPGTVFHRAQAAVYHRLLQGENVVLSAPTSFGKSRVVDAMIATGRFRNVAVVVPTIALIDETRRRLFARFGGEYRIVTHVGQRRGERNLFVLTQERVVEFGDLGRIDFFAIDEFYKLDPRREPDRSGILNEALYRLRAGGGQFYLLGPNIEDVPEAFTRAYGCAFVRTDYATVVTETERVSHPGATRAEALVALARRLRGEPTLIYARSPGSARAVAALLVGAGPGTERPELAGAVRWASEQYHPDWAFLRALARGVGVHHGRLPRSLSQYVVRAFDEGKLDYLVCTSTLIEGVNTKAKNVVVYDNRIADQKLDFFDFSNIRGRAGRMMRHFVGRVFLFAPEPAAAYPDVDVPLVTQPTTTSASLLIQLEDADLTPESRARVQPFRDQSLLDLAVLRANRGIDPADQLRLAEHMLDQADRYYARLGWDAVPRTVQLQTVCDLIWEYLRPRTTHAHGARSARQLARRVGRLGPTSGVRALIDEELASRGEGADVDEVVEETLDFLRYWASYHFPRYLMAVHRIQAVVLPRAGYFAGDYTAFAGLVENLFAPAGIAALEEYGVPLQVGLKLRGPLEDAPDLDVALERLRRLDPGAHGLDPFERNLVEDARRHV